ncbi:hypothetical protein V0288_05225 [Pannus brasiliensis CCIBt3594]|uniref:Uncharacterized protein n=1 Tax=Pannus brasiliensis CCIBt3594 TaxID=1427578 RepID=A0AAW9QHG1_9CHRO
MLKANDRVMYAGAPATVLKVWTKKAMILTQSFQKLNVFVTELASIDGQLEIPLDAPTARERATAPTDTTDTTDTTNAPTPPGPEFAPGDLVRSDGSRCPEGAIGEVLEVDPWTLWCRWPNGELGFLNRKTAVRAYSTPDEGIEREDKTAPEVPEFAPGDKVAYRETAGTVVAVHDETLTVKLPPDKYRSREYEARVYKSACRKIDSIPDDGIEDDSIAPAPDSIPDDGIEGEEVALVEDSIPDPWIEGEASDSPPESSIPDDGIEGGESDHPESSTPDKRRRSPRFSTGERVKMHPLGTPTQIADVAWSANEREWTYRLAGGSVYWCESELDPAGDRPDDSIPSDGIEGDGHPTASDSIPDDGIEGDSIAPAGDSVPPGGWKDPGFVLGEQVIVAGWKGERTILLPRWSDTYEEWFYQVSGTGGGWFRERQLSHVDDPTDSLIEEGIEGEESDRPGDSIPDDGIEGESDREDGTALSDGLEGEESDREGDSIPEGGIEGETVDRSLLDESIASPVLEPKFGRLDKVVYNGHEYRISSRIFEGGEWQYNIAPVREGSARERWVGESKLLLDFVPPEPKFALGQSVILPSRESPARIINRRWDSGCMVWMYRCEGQGQDCSEPFLSPADGIEPGGRPTASDSIPDVGIEREESDRTLAPIPDPWDETEGKTPAGDSIPAEGIEGEDGEAIEWKPGDLLRIGEEYGEVEDIIGNGILYRLVAPFAKPGRTWRMIARDLPERVDSIPWSEIGCEGISLDETSIDPSPGADSGTTGDSPDPSRTGEAIDVLEATTIRLLALREIIEAELIRRGVLSPPPGPIVGYSPPESFPTRIPSGEKVSPPAAGGKRSPGTASGTGSIGTYCKGEAEYYRYGYREGGRKRWKHIGPVTDATARSLADSIGEMIAAGLPASEILLIFERKAS